MTAVGNLFPHLRFLLMITWYVKLSPGMSKTHRLSGCSMYLNKLKKVTDTKIIAFFLAYYPFSEK